MRHCCNEDKVLNTRICITIFWSGLSVFGVRHFMSLYLNRIGHTQIEHTQWTYDTHIQTIEEAMNGQLTFLGQEIWCFLYFLYKHAHRIYTRM